MKIAYLTSTNFLDTAIDTIQSIKNKVELHVYIEITDLSKISTIAEVESIKGFSFIENPQKVLGEKQWHLFKPYFEGVASVQFVVHHNKRSFSPITLAKMFYLGYTIHQKKFDAIHFDNISYRALGLFPFIRNKKFIVTLHDPLPHSGEEKGFNKERMVNSFFLRHAHSFVFYSKFAAKQFQNNFHKNDAPVYTIRMQPCSFFKQSASLQKQINDDGAILFFGRLSYYKGIDILIQAIPLILQAFPNQKFIIAGKPSYDYQIDQNSIDKISNNVEVITRFINVKDASTLIYNSKFLVCPYRDATQSGVLTTAAALGKTLVASKVGSFSEYIDDNVNGLLASPDAQDFANKVIYALSKNHYLNLEKKINTSLTDEELNNISTTLIKAYT